MLRVATRCTSADQFVEAFARFCDGRTLFVSSLSTRPIGTRLPFVILLADGARAMRGQCEVIESYANPGNIYRRPGVKLALTELDDDSEAMLSRLQEARAIRDARSTGVHQAVSAAAIELQSDARAAVPSPAPSAAPSPVRTPVPAPPPPRPPAGPPRPPPGAKVPSLPPLPKLERPRAEPPAPAPASEPHWLSAHAAVARRPDDGLRRGEHIETPVRPSAAAIPPPPTDDTDAGWGDDERPASSTTPPPPAAPTDEDSAPAMIVAAAPDHAGAADVAAAGNTVEAVPVVELINRSRESGRHFSRPITASGATGRVSTRMRSTPGDVYSAEERTPGSSFILPANPLSDLSDEALQGFVDLTIYEDHSLPEPVASDPAISGNRLGMVEDPEPEPDFRAYAPAPEAAPRRTLRMQASGELRLPDESPAATPIELVQKRPTSQLPAVDDEEDEDDLLPPAAPAAVPAPAPAPVRAKTTPPPIAPAARSRALTPPPPVRASRPTPPPPVARAHRPTPPPPLPPPPATPSTSRPDWMAPPPSVEAKARPRVGTRPPAKKPNRWLLPTVTLVALAAAAVILYLRYQQQQRSLAGGGPVRPPPAIDAGTTAALAIDAGTTPPVDAGAPVAVDAATAVASETCHLTVTSTPAGAAIALDRRNLGDAPVDTDVPCGTATVTARAAKYQTWTRQVTLQRGKPVTVRARLSRPMHTLTIISTPRPAAVFLDGKRVGVTNMELKVEAFTKHTLTIEREGYQTYKTMVSVDETEQTVAVLLVKLP